MKKNTLFEIVPAAAFAFLLSLSACSSAPRAVENTISERETAAPVSQVKVEFIDTLRGSQGKTSFTEYESGLQALDEDPLTAMHYFDLALDELHNEQQADTLNSAEDSAYFAQMPNRILAALETLYPKLIEFANSESAYSMLNDYELFDSFEETPLDSEEMRSIENFLDTIDFAKFSLPLVINERVMQEIHYLTVNARSFTEGSLSRKTLLDSMIYAKLNERNMPADIIYLAFVESGFKTSAYSRAKAAGVWQFIPATGKRYGLPVDFWVDMRRNPELATDAALDYLSALYKEFGDWHLAMAAYNCGEGRIRRLLREAKADSSRTDSANSAVSYWDLKLPRETMHYVPRILAATIIGHFPQHYNFTPEKQRLIPSDTVSVQDCIPLDKVGSAIGVSANTMRELNPELTRWCTPPNLKNYTMRVPQGSRDKFLTAYAKMDKTQLIRWQQYKVQRGDNLGYISRQFGIKVADIQSANNMKNSKLSIGQVLIIPMPSGAYKANATPVASKNAVSSGNKASAVPLKNAVPLKTEKISAVENTRSYTVRKGDNLAAISRRFGVSQSSLKSWNNLHSNKIAIGQKLYLQDPSKKAPKKSEVVLKSVSGGVSYTVKNGDNLWDIARNHNLTVQQLLEWNPGIDKKIFPGMKIKIGE
ncbi:hypothetical protein AGMMS49938_09380 [Fibrobacterales bacterium]|nr:hypothetical protein AGMMS49938_09380 [Fibrobacterales bacterium]